MKGKVNIFCRILDFFTFVIHLFMLCLPINQYLKGLGSMFGKNVPKFSGIVFLQIAAISSFIKFDRFILKELPVSTRRKGIMEPYYRRLQFSSIFYLDRNFKSQLLPSWLHLRQLIFIMAIFHQISQNLMKI